jgi:hypothetical protein
MRQREQETCDAEQETMAREHGVFGIPPQRMVSEQPRRAQEKPEAAHPIDGFGEHWSKRRLAMGLRSGAAQPHAGAVSSPPGARVTPVPALLVGGGSLANAMRRGTGEGQHDYDCNQH